ncbi:MAG: MGMT family protein [Thermoplasmata archaeon]|nr:MAG: MGMT family protein [Thermoplasmata archaeon]
MKRRRTKREELEKERDLPKIVDTPKGKMVVPNPLDIDALMRKIPRGKLVTVDQIREKMAKDFQVDFTCPMTTGMFIRMAGEAAEEDLTKGKKRITSYWRVIKIDGSLNPKFPGGVEAQAIHLKEEGHVVEPGKGKKPPKVKDFEKYLQKL